MFLNFGMFSSFEVSETENLDVTAQPLHDEKKRLYMTKIKSLITVNVSGKTDLNWT
mgnify:FL=1